MSMFVKQVINELARALMEFSRTAGTATGEALGSWLVANLDEVISRIQVNKIEPAPISVIFDDLETANFLRGGVFSEMKKQQLIGSALVGFDRVPVLARQRLLEWAIRRSQGDPVRALYNFLFAISKYNKCQ